MKKLIIPITIFALLLISCNNTNKIDNSKNEVSTSESIPEDNNSTNEDSNDNNDESKNGNIDEGGEYDGSEEGEYIYLG